MSRSNSPKHKSKKSKHHKSKSRSRDRQKSHHHHSKPDRRDNKDYHHHRSEKYDKRERYDKYEKRDNYDSRKDKYDNKDRQRRRSRSSSYNRRDKNRDFQKPRQHYKEDKYIKSNEDRSLKRMERKMDQRRQEREEDERAERQFRQNQQIEDEKPNLNYLSQSDANRGNTEYEKRGKKDYNNKNKNAGEEQNEEESENKKEEVNYEATGILAEFENKVNGVTQKFTEPEDAAPPVEKWRIYPYKGDEELPVIALKGFSCFLFGKDQRVAQIPVLNPTCSQQHAVLQFREKRQFDQLTGEYSSEIIPYLMDLESTNGTKLNGQKIEPARYYQILSKDVINFGLSDRDYIVMKF